ncbi:MAG TPA: MarR family transcriptional regulator [Gaiellaceae bacterium]|nr:MarR family transcriptional regulator [Gaiellaceae bacterium]
MSSQVTQVQEVLLEAWTNLLRAHAVTTRQFNAELLAAHGLTINDFDVLAQLARAPEKALKRVDLSGRVLLTPSGITRLLKGLEEAGYVSNRPCAEDARVTYAVLTPEGEKKLVEARKTHIADVREVFSRLFTEDELEVLAELLERIPARELPCD